MNESTKRTINPGESWRHFKGKEVRILCLAKNESDGTDMVVYTEGTNTWIRPLNEFLSEIDFGKYPDYDRNTQKYRFEKVSDDTDFSFLDNELSRVTNPDTKIDYVPVSMQAYNIEKLDYDTVCILIAFNIARFAKELECINGITGFQHGYIAYLVNRLINNYPVKPIRSIAENPDEWLCIDDYYGDYKEESNIHHYQSKRHSCLFAETVDVNKDDVIYTDVERFHPIDVLNSYSDMYIFTYTIKEFMDTKYPITMPYFPDKDVDSCKFMSFPTAKTNFEYIYTTETEFECYVAIFDMHDVPSTYWFYLVRDELTQISYEEFTNALNDYMKHTFDTIKPGAIYASSIYGLISIPFVNFDMEITPSIFIPVQSCDGQKRYLVNGKDFLDITTMKYKAASLDAYLDAYVDHEKWNDDDSDNYTESQIDFIHNLIDKNKQC